MFESVSAAGIAGATTGKGELKNFLHVIQNGFGANTNNGGWRLFPQGSAVLRSK
jgi:hypothetical protein